MYDPSLPPNITTIPALLQWFLAELRRIAEALRGPTIDDRGSAPTKPEHGRIYFANGTTWNPGSGRGFYGYDATGPTWRFLG